MSTKFFESKKSGGSKPKGSVLKLVTIGTLALGLTAGAGFGAYKMVQSGIANPSLSNTSPGQITTSNSNQANPAPIVHNRTFFDSIKSQPMPVQQELTKTLVSKHKIGKASHSRHGKKYAKHSRKHGRHYAKHGKKHGKHFAKHSKRKHGKHLAKHSKKSKSHRQRELASTGR